MGLSMDCPNFCGFQCSGTCKAMNFKFSTHIYSISQKQSPLKILGKVAMGIVRDSQKFSGHSYIKCIAQSSLQ